MNEHPFDEMMRMKSPKRLDEMLDMIVWASYFAGQFGNKIPVDRTRALWGHMKEIIKKHGLPS